jgi:hypothetical protein
MVRRSLVDLVRRDQGLQFNLCLVVMYDKPNCGIVGVILKLSH